MPITANLSNVLNPESIDQTVSLESTAFRQKTITVNGVEYQRGSSEAKIAKTSQKLFADGSQSDNSSLQSILFFEALGAVVSKDQGKDYSLVSDQTNNTKINNPNIDSSSALSVRIEGNAGLSVSKSFTFSDDPIFETSADTTESKDKLTERLNQSKLETGTKLLSTASDIATLNSSSSSSLKQFTDVGTTSAIAGTTSATTTQTVTSQTAIATQTVVRSY